jgi:hypothetical protein
MAVTDHFDVAPDMRAFAEKSIEQARQTFDRFIPRPTTQSARSKARPRAPAKAPRMSLKRR